MDACMLLFRTRFEKNPGWFRSTRICFVDTLLHSMWVNKYELFKKSPPTNRLFPNGAFHFVLGEESKACKTDKAWGLDVDDVYGTLHIKGSHWVAMCISLPARHITIWDSDIVHASPFEIAAAVEPIAVMLPHLLRECFVDDKEEISLDPFTHCRIEDGSVPQNIQSGDCGVFAVKYIECHALGMPFPSTLCDKNIKDIRDKLAADIFEETDERGSDRADWEVVDMYE